MKTHINILVLLLLLTGFVQGQTVNTGELYVTPGSIFSTVAAFNNTPTGTFINDGDVYVYANWHNDGMVDFLGTTGITRYVGANTQTISGNEFSYLYDAQFDNATTQPAFNLSGAISVANESDYTLGIVDNDNFGGTFQFEQGAGHLMTSDQSHVDGPVVKVGDVAFEYPIGDAGYFRFAGISAPEMASDIFTGKYFFEDTNSNYPVDNLGPNLTLIDNAEHWTIERTTGDSDVLVTLSWRDVTTPSDILVAPFDAIHIARWDNALQLWVDEGGVVDVDNQTVTTAVDAYGVFTLARAKTETMPLIINNLITPDGDGKNDYFEIKQAENDYAVIENMTVKVFNRWGVKVFEADNYNQGNNKFRGYSDGRMTIASDKILPTGTYFYILTYDYQNNNTTQTIKKAGYLYINK